MKRTPRYWLARSWNVCRRVVAGLPLHSECVWPGVRNDLFVAHQSVYRFFAQSARRKRVLDAGCGTGYGSMEMLRSGARSVLGIDIERRNIAYARRHYIHPDLHFRQANCEHPQLVPDSLDLIVSSNVMEHLYEPGSLLRAAQGALSRAGEMLLAIPAIVDANSLAMNQANPYHRSNLSVDEWLDLFKGTGWAVTQIFCQTLADTTTKPDFASPFPSNLAATEFVFRPTDRDELYATPVLGAIYALRRRCTAASDLSRNNRADVLSNRQVQTTTLDVGEGNGSHASLMGCQVSSVTGTWRGM